MTRTPRGYRPHRATPTAKLARGAERRFQLAGPARHQVNHVFPWHFSFLWGEIALYSFVLLVGTGILLTLFYVPAEDHVTYLGSYAPAFGVDASRAWASVMDISVDVRGGLFLRQMHHWAALVFLAAIMLHMARNFFTGAYRAPRELNWVIGVVMLVVSILEGYLGYSMLDDLLSGTGVRIFSGILLSIPVIGTWLHWMLFQYQFPGDIYLERFFIGHVLLLPAVLFALIAVHLGLVWYQKHTHFAGPRARESNVVGQRTMPMFAMHSVSMMLGTTAVIGLLGGIAQINPIFHYGPYNPAHVANGDWPDWYALWLIGSLKVFPRAAIAIAGRYTIPPGFWGGVVIPAVLIVLLLAWPLIDRWRDPNRELHNLLDRPRDDAGRTAIGAMALTFWGLLQLAGTDDFWMTIFQIPVEGMRWFERVGLIVLPPLVYWVTKRYCLRLQRLDRERISHGIPTGLVARPRDGVYRPVHQPVVGTDPEGGEHPARDTGARVPTTPTSPSSEGTS